MGERNEIEDGMGFAGLAPTHEEAEREIKLISAKRLAKLCSEEFERANLVFGGNLDRESFDVGFWAGIRCIEGRELMR